MKKSIVILLINLIVVFGACTNNNNSSDAQQEETTVSEMINVETETSVDNPEETRGITPGEEEVGQFETLEIEDEVEIPVEDGEAEAGD